MRRGKNVCLSLFIFTFTLLSSNLTFGDTVKITFTADDSYSIEVVTIDVGDTIEWLPKNKGHNVKFLEAPNMKSPPEK